MCRSIRHAVVALLAPTLVIAAPHAHARLVVDHVDTSRFVADGVLRVFVDLLDDEDIPAIPATVELAVDGRPIAATTSISTVMKVREPAALALVVPRTYAFELPDFAEQGLMADPAASVHEGARTLLGALPSFWSSYVMRYDEAGATVLAGWSQAHREAAAKLTRRPPGPPAVLAPPLDEAIGQALDAFAAASNQLPRRRVLVLVSDGVDRSERGRDARIRELAERAQALGVRVVVIGFTLAAEEPLVALEELAALTGGRYERVPVSHVALLQLEIVAVAARLMAQHVLDVTPTTWRGAAGPVELGLVVTPAEPPGATPSKRVLSAVRVPVR